METAKETWRTIWWLIPFLSEVEKTVKCWCTFCGIPACLMKFSSESFLVPNSLPIPTTFRCVNKFISELLKNLIVAGSGYSLWNKHNFVVFICHRKKNPQHNLQCFYSSLCIHWGICDINLRLIKSLVSHSTLSNALNISFSKFKPGRTHASWVKSPNVCTFHDLFS